MDEATSSIDTATEQLVQAGVEEILKGRIAFVVAHRLSTIRRADLILVIEKGCIAEQGTHRELLAKRGRYWELYTNQFAADRERELLHLKDEAKVQTVASLVGDGDDDE
jgi:ATP-binding cassette subfamily B protein